MNFASDNTAGVAPEILQALVAGNDGFAMGYGNDDLPARWSSGSAKSSSATLRCFWCRPGRLRTHWRWRM
jgi:threonine aldolase